jgi:hypothetical protein
VSRRQVACLRAGARAGRASKGAFNTANREQTHGQIGVEVTDSVGGYSEKRIGSTVGDYMAGEVGNMP